MGSPSSTGQNSAWPLWLSYVMYALSLAVGVYTIFLMVTTPFYVRQQLNVLPHSNLPSIDSLPVLKDVNAYRALLEQHPLFGIKTKEVAAPARSACDEFQQKFVLSGIITGGQSEALFTSKVGDRTHFSHVGESIGGVTIEAIQSQSILISCSGKQVEILMEGT